ncbi:MAG TPA: DUF2017 family protein [Actinomycetota bacterium]
MASAFKRVGKDRYRLRLNPEEVGVLRDLPEQLRSVLDADEPDPVTERLFPPAYRDPGDVERQDEYRRLVHDELVAAKLANLELVTGTLERGQLRQRRWTVELTEEEALAWLGVLNDLRLALGVRLDITEDFDGVVVPDDPDAPARYLLSYLGWLEEHLVAALSA